MSFSTLWRGIASPRGRSWIRRSVAWIAASSFLWSFILAAPAQLLAQSALHPAKPLGIRLLSEAEMARISGSSGGLHATSAGVDGGSTYPWEVSVNGGNTVNGNKLSSIPIVSWTARGGLPVSFTLNHSSQSTHDSELGSKWTHSFDIYLVNSSGDLTLGRRSVLQVHA